MGKGRIAVIVEGAKREKDIFMSISKLKTFVTKGNMEREGNKYDSKI